MENLDRRDNFANEFSKIIEKESQYFTLNFEDLLEVVLYLMAYDLIYRARDDFFSETLAVDDYQSLIENISRIMKFSARFNDAHKEIVISLEERVSLNYQLFNFSSEEVKQLGNIFTHYYRHMGDFDYEDIVYCYDKLFYRLKSLEKKTSLALDAFMAGFSVRYFYGEDEGGYREIPLNNGGFSILSGKPVVYDSSQRLPLELYFRGILHHQKFTQVRYDKEIIDIIYTDLNKLKFSTKRSRWENAVLAQLKNGRAQKQVFLLGGQDMSLLQDVQSDLMESLNSHSVVTIISLPAKITPLTNVQLYMLVINPDKRKNDRVLFVNADKLAKKLNISSSKTASLVADIVRLHEGKSLSLSDADGHINFLNKYYQEGYRDISEISASVTISQIFKNGMKLKPSVYIAKDPQAISLSLLDVGPVMREMEKASGQALAAYIIGRNGEGKSLLLREIASILLSENRPVIALPQSIHDRIHTLVQKKNSGFTYLGVRSPSGGVNIVAREKALVDKIIHTLSHPDRANIQLMCTVLQKIGFGKQIYLLSRGRIAAETIDTQVVDKDSGALDTALFTSDGYTFGVLKDKNNIVPFQNLSSGEQLMVQFALQVTLYASRGATMLIDEPEISLHVEWQQLIPSILELVNQQIAMHIVVATHAPVVIAATKNRQSCCFIAENRALEPIDANSVRSVESILLELFKVTTLNSRSVYENCARMMAEIAEMANSGEDISQKVSEAHQRISALKTLVTLQKEKIAIGAEELVFLNQAERALNEFSVFQQNDASGE
ncbi:AAA family ATPase [Pantoea coffeiphila]|uniref:AAA family ATPase n=1 Tax=Pantoea coffeiphila TaxID=1465635 RepID=UPI0019610E2E|nr:AAA family ATPase [Pantoea coffeiphila]MBM7342911.1 ABC-type transport system involved in cytochrome c biogenesis ATPase subunit [Pantoea coffeiphila]